MAIKVVPHIKAEAPAARCPLVNSSLPISEYSPVVSVM
jgi:hypothetical protein